MNRSNARGVNNSKPTFPYIVVRFKGLKPIIFCFAPNRGKYVCQHSRYGRLELYFQYAHRYVLTSTGWKTELRPDLGRIICPKKIGEPWNGGIGRTLNSLLVGPEYWTFQKPKEAK